MPSGSPAIMCSPTVFSNTDSEGCRIAESAHGEQEEEEEEEEE